MSTIGLYDLDINKTEILRPNLNLMKISSYHKKRRDIVSMTTKFSPEFFSRYYIQKNLSGGESPPLWKYNNIQYGGFAFTGGEYIPIPEEVEASVADSTIYEKMRVGRNRRVLEKEIHLRLSRDEKTIWGNYLSQVPQNINDMFTLVLHDRGLGTIEGDIEIVETLYNQLRKTSLRRICAMSPIKILNVESFIRWTAFEPSRWGYPLAIYCYVPDDVFVSGADKIGRLGKGALTFYVGDGVYGGEQLKKNLPSLVRQVLYAYTNRRRLRFQPTGNYDFPKEYIRFFEIVNYCSTIQARDPYKFLVSTLRKDYYEGFPYLDWLKIIDLRLYEEITRHNHWELKEGYIHGSWRED